MKTVDQSGVVSQTKYGAWGNTRSSSGTAPTKKKYTGQYEAEAGLYFYNARWYDPGLGRFAQADSIVPEPGNPMAWDRYAYVLNNPIRFTDPTGNDVDCGIGEKWCRDLVKREKEDSLLSTIRNNETVITWENLSQTEQKILSDVGWTQYDFDHSDYVIPGVKNISGTLQDPLIYISLIVGYGVKGPAISGGKYLIDQAAYACFRNPICGKLIFGVPATYAPRLGNQSDPFHNFPRLLDPIIIEEGARVVKSSNYVEYQIAGEVALAKGLDIGYKVYQGVFQIGVQLINFVPVITHHFFKK